MTLREPEHVDLPTAAGPMRSHLFRPAAAGAFPGVILFSEIFQLTPSVRRTAAALAGHGYLVLAPEIWHEFEPPGCVLGYDKASSERGNSHKGRIQRASIDADARVLVDYLLNHDGCTGRLGTFGLCVGGHMAVRAAALNPSIRATVAVYATDLHRETLGQGGEGTLSMVGRARAEMIFFWGRQDPHIPAEGRMAVYQALAGQGVAFSWHEFAGQHAFIRDEGLRYDPAHAAQVQALYLELLHRRLGFAEGPDEVAKAVG